MATGNGIESAFTNAFDPVFCRVPLTELALCRELADVLVPGAALGGELAAGGGVVAVAVEVFPAAWPGTSGAVAVPTPVHPARAMMAAPARAARTDPCLPMQLPRSGGRKARLNALRVKILAAQVTAQRRKAPH
jgi:hypothetical protein